MKLRTITCIVLVWILLPRVNSQPFNSWAFGLGSAGLENTNRSAATFANGDLLFGGYFSGSMDMDPGSAAYDLITGTKDGFAARYTIHQELVYAVRIGGTGADEITDVAIYNDNAYLTGYTEGNGTFSCPSPGYSYNYNSLGVKDGFLIKLNSDGTEQWRLRFGNPMVSVIPLSMTTRSWGNVIIVGKLDGNGTVDFDPGAGTVNVAAPCMFMAEYDVDGNLVAAKGITTTALPKDVKVSAGGIIYIVGVFNGTVDFDPDAGVESKTSNGNDIFIAGYTYLFNLESVFVMGSTGSDIANAIVMGANDDIFVTGTFQGTVDFDPGSAISNLQSSTANVSGFIARYDQTAGLRWALKLESNVAGGATYAYEIAYETGSSDIQVTGASVGMVNMNPNGTAFSLSIGSSTTTNPFVARYDEDGQMIWAHAHNGDGAYSEAGNCLAFANDQGGYYYIGSYRSMMDMDPSPTELNVLTSVSGTWDIAVAFYSNACRKASVPVATASKGIVCYGQDSARLKIVSGQLNQNIEWRWYAGASLVGIGDSIDVSPASNTKYKVYGAGGCAYANGKPDSIEIQVYELPEVEVVADDIAVCKGERVVLRAGGASSYKWQDGSVADSLEVNPLQTTVYIVKGFSMAGCFSMAQDTVEIIQPDTGISISGDTLRALGNNLNYQWVTCPGHVPVAGATAKSFVPLSDGEYALIVTDPNEGCTDTSSCYLFAKPNGLAVPENDMFRVYPNPANKIITITSSVPVNVKVYSVTGAILLVSDLQEGNNQLDISALGTGIYIVEIGHENLVLRKKLVKQ